MQPECKLEQALKLIRETQETVKSFGYHICLGGGVLNLGYSYKDLDLYIIPLCDTENKLEDLVQSLEIGWGPSYEVFSIFEQESVYANKMRFMPQKLNNLPCVVEVFIVKQ